MAATTETTDITVVSGPTSPGTASDWELFFARRALAMLKARLGHQGLLDLLQPDLAASAKTLTACAASSGGQWRPARTQLHAEGLSAAEFLSYFHSIFDDSPQLVAAHPEHFVLAAVDGGHQVVENLGPYITDFRITYVSEDQAIGELAPDYPIRLAGTVALPTAPSSDTPCTNSVTPAPGSTPSWSSTSRPPRRKTSSKDIASTSPWNSPTGSPRPLGRTSRSPVPLVVNPNRALKGREPSARLRLATRSLTGTSSVN
jgi:hypothetical protein